MKIIDSDVNLEYAHAVVMVTVLAVLVYFHVTQRIFRLFYESYQIGSLYFRFVSNILKMLLVCVQFIYRKVACQPANDETQSIVDDDEKPKSKSRKRGSTTKEKSKKTENGIIGTITTITNGSTTPQFDQKKEN